MSTNPEYVADVTNGEIKFTNQSMKVQTFVCGVVDGKYIERVPFMLAKPENKPMLDSLGLEIIKKQYVNSRSGVPIAVGGYLSTVGLKLTHASNEVVIKTTVTRYDHSITDVATIFGVIRGGGQISMVKVPRFIKGTKVGSKIVFSTEPKVVTSGSFELITLEQAENVYSVKVPMIRRASCHVEMWKKLLSHKVIQDSTTSRPSVDTLSLINDQGERVEVKRRSNRRIL